MFSKELNKNFFNMLGPFLAQNVIPLYLNSYQDNSLYHALINRLIKWASGLHQPACQCMEIKKLIDTGISPDKYPEPQFKTFQSKLKEFKKMLSELCSLNYQCKNRINY